MRRYSKGIISFLLCAAIIASVGVTALAALEVSPAPEDTGDGTSILDEADISARVNELIQQYVAAGNVKESELAIAYTYLATGDSWYKNPDMWFYSASIYKVPLMMIMAEKEAKGEIDQQTDIMGLPLAQVEKVVLVDSNNDYAHNTMRFLTGETEKKSFEKGTRPMYQAYSSLPEKYYHKDFVDYSYFSARFMNDVMSTLYNEQSRFPNVIGLLKQANPGKYFHLVLGDEIEIAQKYGYFKDSRQTEWHNNTGIIYTPNPFILTVLSADARKGEQFMGDLAALFAEYTLELDDQLAAYEAEQERLEQERIAAEKAAAEAEAKAKAEEEARRAKEEADRIAAQEAALRAAEKEEKAAERKESISKILKYVGIAGAGVLVLLIVVGILSTIRKRSALEEEEPKTVRRGSRKTEEFDDEEDDGFDEDDSEDEDEEEDEEEEVRPRRSSTGGGLVRKKSAPARRRGYDEDDEDEDEDDEDDEEERPPRRGKTASIAAMRRRAAVEDEEEDEEEEEPAPRRAFRTPAKAQRPSAPARKAPVYEEEEDDEEEEPAPRNVSRMPERVQRPAAPAYKAPVYKTPAYEEEEDEEEEPAPRNISRMPERVQRPSAPAYKAPVYEEEDEDEEEEPAPRNVSRMPERVQRPAAPAYKAPVYEEEDEDEEEEPAPQSIFHMSARDLRPAAPADVPVYKPLVSKDTKKEEEDINFTLDFMKTAPSRPSRPVEDEEDEADEEERRPLGFGRGKGGSSGGYSPRH